jgi:hypothetical protein
MYRSIVEMSCMQNNDERVLYTEEEILYDQVKEHINGNRFDSPKLVFSRPVFDAEIDDGLNFAMETNNKIPDITRFLDALYRLKVRFDFVRELKKANPQDWDPIPFIIRDITSQFYDCMSGGLPVYLGSIVKEIIDFYPNIDLDMTLYPKDEEEDYLLKDFLKEMENAPDIKQHLTVMRKQIPCLPGFLLESGK